MQSDIKAESQSRYQRWRLLKDQIARYGITIGGWAIIAAVVLIFFYLLYVVIPLFKPASSSVFSEFGLPASDQGKTIHLAVEEQNEIGVRFTDQARAIFFKIHDGQEISRHEIIFPNGTQVTSHAIQKSGDGYVAYGLSDGRVVIAEHSYQSTFPNNQRLITPNLNYPLGQEALVLDKEQRPLQKIALQGDDDNVTLAGIAGNKVLLLGLSKQKTLFGESSLERTESEFEVPAPDIAFVLIDKEQQNLYLATLAGQLTVYDIRDKQHTVLTQQISMLAPGITISSLEFLNGGLSLLVGDSSGSVAQWSKLRNEQNISSMIKLRSFKVADVPVVQLAQEQRRKGFVSVDQSGKVRLFNTTAERELLSLDKFSGAPVAFALAPRADAFVFESQQGRLHSVLLDNEHPEVSFRALWQKVWYESYPKPSYIWQSSSSSNDFEPKYSLMPLVFGTLKAAFYAMLFAIPMSLMGAIYASYFMSPSMRQIVKPTIELMGALPTVILGFLAGLWLAPFMEGNLLTIFLSLIFLPVGVMLFALAWQGLPKSFRSNVPDGMEAIILIPVIIAIVSLAFAISPALETLFFGGDLKTWMSTELGIRYDQRNSLVVGIAMGFAVIPSIFTIAEDAIFSVPKHLTVGSLALGATPWQTMMRVVLLTASPGIFSAIMIGLGRAIGETMIVLMATGNTPVMDMSIFDGLRTLAANVAVEMPESEVNSTHYRVLFLSALVLFLFTFVFNTLAEVVRQRLREKYSSL